MRPAAKVRRAIPVRASVCVGILAIAAGSAFGGNQAEVNKHAASAAVDALKAIKAALSGNLIAAAWYNGWAIGEDINAAAWALKASGYVFSQPRSDPQYASVVMITSSTSVMLDPITGGQVFDIPIISPNAANAMNLMMMHEMAVSNAYAGFILSDRRVVGAVNAGDFGSAQARLAQMQAFRSAALSEIPAAVAAIQNLKAVMMGEGLDIFFTATEGQSFQAMLAANGHAGYSSSYLAGLHAAGFTDAHIDGELLPRTLGLTFTNFEFFEALSDQLSVYTDTGTVLQEIIDARAPFVVPAPSVALTGAVFALGAFGRRRRPA